MQIFRHLCFFEWDGQNLSHYHLGAAGLLIIIVSSFRSFVRKQERPQELFLPLPTLPFSCLPPWGSDLCSYKALAGDPRSIVHCKDECRGTSHLPAVSRGTSTIYVVLGFTWHPPCHVLWRDSFLPIPNVHQTPVTSRWVWAQVRYHDLEAKGTFMASLNCVVPLQLAWSTKSSTADSRLGWRSAKMPSACDIICWIRIFLDCGSWLLSPLVLAVRAKCSLFALGRMGRPPSRL